MMQTTTLCLPVQGNPPVALLLGHKLRGVGQGKLTGFGGKVEPGESVVAAAVRELREEAGLVTTPADLLPMGVVTFCFPMRPQWDQQVHLFLVERWDGVPTASDEMDPIWVSVADLPYAAMWQDTAYWLPSLLRRQPVTATITFAPDHETVIQVATDAVVNQGCEPSL
jgi:8-oxo-dGTP pyrophosphatase MutT (NUDIX family)